MKNSTSMSPFLVHRCGVALLLHFVNPAVTQKRLTWTTSSSELKSIVANNPLLLENMSQQFSFWQELAASDSQTTAIIEIFDITAVSDILILPSVASLSDILIGESFSHTQARVLRRREMTSIFIHPGEELLINGLVCYRPSGRGSVHSILIAHCGISPTTMSYSIRTATRLVDEARSEKRRKRTLKLKAATALIPSLFKKKKETYDTTNDVDS